MFEKVVGVGKERHMLSITEGHALELHHPVLRTFTLWKLITNQSVMCCILETRNYCIESILPVI